MPCRTSSATLTTPVIQCVVSFSRIRQRANTILPSLGKDETPESIVLVDPECVCVSSLDWTDSLELSRLQCLLLICLWFLTIYYVTTEMISLTTLSTYASEYSQVILCMNFGISQVIANLCQKHLDLFRAPWLWSMGQSPQADPFNGHLHLEQIVCPDHLLVSVFGPRSKW